MAEYDMPIEEQVKLLVREFHGLKGSMETRFDSVDSKLESLDGTFASLDGKVASLDGKVASLDGKVTSLDGKVTSLDGKVESLAGKVTSLDGKVTSLDGKVETLDGKVVTVVGKVDKLQILLEQTHAIAKLGLEGLEGLRESTDEKFAAAAKVNAEQTGLLKSLVVHVRNRVDRVEPTKPGRRRR